MAASPKPTVHLSLAKVRKEVEKPEPYAVGLSNSKIIVFPDLFAMESEKAEDLLARIRSGQQSWPILRQWLSKGDVEALKAEELTFAELLQVMRAANDYYEGIYGKSGEDDASES